jgi:hypothetical protein
LAIGDKTEAGFDDPLARGEGVFEFPMNDASKLFEELCDGIGGNREDENDEVGGTSGDVDAYPRNR